MSLLIASLVFAQATANAIETRPLSPSETTLIQTAVTGELSDPESARFKMLPLAIGSDRYCGMVNAKNQFGGYVGYRNFSVWIKKDKNGKVILAEQASIDSARKTIASNLLYAYCVSEGYSVLEI